MRLGLCLSGGAARGVVHLGVMKALRELNVPINVISGVSSGAITAVFLSAGYSPEEVLRLVQELNVPKLIKPALNKGVLHNLALQKIFEQHLQGKTFADLSCKVIVSALDLVEGTTVYFTEGSLVQALMASSAVPVLFKPVSWQGKQLVDGGIANNLPVECLTGECDKIIGVHANPTPHNSEIPGIRQVTERIFHLALNANVRPRIAYCDLFLEPPKLKEYHIYALNKAQEIFEIGYEYTLLLYKEIQALVKEE
ncbi:patatin-like phospholipase family protein [Rufibacter quisquiliarum]|uniref:NTE family protein n=1 Tax=Rufibacter quisquiliarum TaxID=1549639 RepID=A0A839GUK4_9BACT|nr:patatin-like phospholipase family protein [Rufibacter quisquiliarum]MBA9077461.1 NTE family protein [Rufibacter quisquiliarum]